MSWADEWRELNRALWDERVSIHVEGTFYDVEGFLAGRSRLLPFELVEVGAVDGLTLAHPQCHFGIDTLSWVRHGARVTGLDFSAPAVEAARDLALRAGIDAEFVQTDVYDAVSALGGRTFDVVYTGRGALNWLPDIERWAETMASLVRPGGRFFLSERVPPVHRGVRGRAPRRRTIVFRARALAVGRAWDICQPERRNDPHAHGGMGARHR